MYRIYNKEIKGNVYFPNVIDDDEGRKMEREMTDLHPLRLEFNRSPSLSLSLSLARFLSLSLSLSLIFANLLFLSSFQ